MASTFDDLPHLTNVVRHTEATHLSIIIELRDEQLHALVEDNGQGFNVEELKQSLGKRLGIVGMRERLELAGGALNIESTPGEGTAIIARIPVSTVK